MDNKFDRFTLTYFVMSEAPISDGFTNMNDNKYSLYGYSQSCWVFRLFSLAGSHTEKTGNRLEHFRIIFLSIQNQPSSKFSILQVYNRFGK